MNERKKDKNMFLIIIINNNFWYTGRYTSVSMTKYNTTYALMYVHAHVHIHTTTRANLKVQIIIYLYE